jgi:hypothetical protein
MPLIGASVPEAFEKNNQETKAEASKKKGEHDKKSCPRRILFVKVEGTPVKFKGRPGKVLSTARPHMVDQ